MTDAKMIEATVEMMRRLGIVRLHDGDMEIELAPEKVAATPDAFAPEVTDEDNLCNCGHGADHHMDGLCIEGCETTLCRKRL
jgi:hypothetical protein